MARRGQPARTRPAQAQAQDRAKSVATVVWPDGNDGPEAAPAQSEMGGLARPMRWLTWVSTPIPAPAMAHSISPERTAPAPAAAGRGRQHAHRDQDRQDDSGDPAPPQIVGDGDADGIAVRDDPPVDALVDHGHGRAALRDPDGEQRESQAGCSGDQHGRATRYGRRRRQRQGVGGLGGLQPPRLRPPRPPPAGSAASARWRASPSGGRVIAASRPGAGFRPARPGIRRRAAIRRRAGAAAEAAS